ncbi:hydrogenase iron-sulfur subunit [Acidobacteria bacterium ACD]|nr:MAG: hydrogenase iron-sulfur subunit [Acidobacteriota bacterium]MCE7957350.1 hydrogenase iron-sulfur subunit [Acidobacteria bacterium ACB2]MDL1949403.1 hydrogenase iron-sulfur subunit [Acidobacteria bacterium ACD]
MTFEPKLVGFLCNWCSYTGADLAGTARIKYPPNLRPIRVMCSGRVDPGFVLEALARGADGVLVCGCHPGDCHYADGNSKCLRRMALTRRLVEALGVDPRRVRLEWVSASEGKRFGELVAEFTDEVRRLGPLVLGEHAFDREAAEAELAPAAGAPALV